MAVPDQRSSDPNHAEEDPVSAIMIAASAGLCGAALAALVAHVFFPLFFEALGSGNEKDHVVAGIVFAVLCAPVGFAATVWWVARRYAPHRKWTRRIFAALAGISGAFLLVMVGVVLAETGINPGRTMPVLDFEVRLPAGAQVPAEHHPVRVFLFRDKGGHGGFFRRQWLRHDGGRPVIMGGYWPDHAGSTSLTLEVPGHPERRFILEVAPNPPAMPEFTAWRRVDASRWPRPDANWVNDPADPTEFRYRIRRVKGTRGER